MPMPPFYSKVLKEVRNIPYGEVRSYKDIASKVGSPNAYRATGTANSKNMIPIICLLYTSPSPRDAHESRMPSSA